MSLQGRIEDLGVGEALYVIAIARRSGQLTLESGAREANLLFIDGRLVAGRDQHGPSSLSELLVSAKLVDATHLAVLERQARTESKPLAELLEEEGVLPEGRLHSVLESKLEDFLVSVLLLKEGRFSFELLDDPASRADAFGGLLLSRGLDLAKMPAVVQASKAGGLTGLGDVSLPRSDVKRKIHLLVGEEEIALPVLRGARSQTTSTGVSRPRVPVSDSAATVIVAIDATGLRRAVTSRLEAAGLRVRKLRGLRDVAGAVAELAGRRGALIADAGPGSTLGLEVLARVRTLDRTMPVTLTLDGGMPPARLAALRRRACRLGVTHVVQLARGGADAEPAAETVADLVDLVTPAAAAAPPTSPPPVAPLPAEAEAPDALFDGSPEGPEPRLARLPTKVQAQHLQLRLRNAHGSREPVDHALAILRAASEYFERGLLVVDSGGRLHGIGLFGSGGAGPRPEIRLTRVAFSPEGGDFLSAAMRDGKPWFGRAPSGPADLEILGLLGTARPERAAVLPLLGSDGCFGALYGDDGGAGGAAEAAQLAELQAFVTSAAGPFEESLQAHERRRLAERARR